MKKNKKTETIHEELKKLTLPEYLTVFKKMVDELYEMTLKVTGTYQKKDK